MMMKIIIQLINFIDLCLNSIMQYVMIIVTNPKIALELRTKSTEEE